MMYKNDSTVMQDVPAIVQDVQWLRLQLLVAWEARLSKASSTTGKAQYAEVTKVFLEVAEDSSIGGVAKSDETAQAADMLMCVWMGAVLTSMLFVPGALPTCVGSSGLLWHTNSAVY